MHQVQHSNQRPPNLSKQTNSLYVKVQFFFSGIHIDRKTKLLRDAIPAVFYLLQYTFILGTYMPPPQVGFWAFLA